MITTSIFPGRYVQGKDALNECLASELQRFGKRVFILLDPTVNQLLGERISELLQGQVDAQYEVFCSECCDEEIQRISELAVHFGAEAIVGIGGGKTLDTTKATGAALNIPIVVIPTLASTDAPCSSLVVIYTKEGKFKRYLVIPQNPNLVLVDSQVIANAPVRFLISGMGDALSTWFEAEDCRIKVAGNMTTRPGSMTAYSLAKLCFDTLLRYGVLAKEACSQKKVTPALDRIIEANTLLSGIGFESGGLAAAHAIHNGLTVLAQTHSYWHGEKVAFGTLAMLMLTDREPELIETVYTFCESVGLPTTLAQLGLDNVSDAELQKVAEAACQPGETIHNEPFPVNPDVVLAALRAADAYGRSRQ
ncbi:glycerol dehydrogenase [Klebsiella pneumoniae]|nr:glycerol dehydrogenase [Klebsiella pneumoniae]